LAHRDIEAQLDAQLIYTAEQIKAFLGDDITKRDLKKVQQNLNANKSGSVETATFQIWKKQGSLLLHSHDAPTAPLSNSQRGLSSIWLNNHSWRVYTDYFPDDHLVIMVAERSNYRQELESQLTQDSIFIMLITYPFLGLLIWVIVGRGLDSLKRVAEEVKHREPHNLKPVDFETVPSEIEPLMSELNSLFHRLQDAFEREKRFTADAAHELKTPLAALTTQVQVALRASTTEARNQALMKVLTGVNRGTHVVQQLLTLSLWATPQRSIFCSVT
jgi:two-component system sensor histidine kinase QseC